MEWNNKRSCSFWAAHEPFAGHWFKAERNQTKRVNSWRFRNQTRDSREPLTHSLCWENVWSEFLTTRVKRAAQHIFRAIFFWAAYNYTPQSGSIISSRAVLGRTFDTTMSITLLTVLSSSSSSLSSSAYSIHRIREQRASLKPRVDAACIDCMCVMFIM